MSLKGWLRGNGEGRAGNFLIPESDTQGVFPGLYHLVRYGILGWVVLLDHQLGLRETVRCHHTNTQHSMSWKAKLFSVWFFSVFFSQFYCCFVWGFVMGFVFACTMYMYLKGDKMNTRINNCLLIRERRRERKRERELVSWE